MATLTLGADNHNYQIDTGCVKSVLIGAQPLQTEVKMYDCDPGNTSYGCAPMTTYMSKEYGCQSIQICDGGGGLVSQEQVTLWADEAACGNMKTYSVKCDSTILTDGNTVAGSDNQDNI